MLDRNTAHPIVKLPGDARQEKEKLMKSEAEFKAAFCKSVEKQGGYTFKIAMSTVSGLPDLYCAFPGFVPVLLEAKFLKDIPVAGKFKRKIPYRPLQREILNNCCKVYGRDNCVAFCLMGIQTENHTFCMLIKPGIEIVTHEDLINELIWVKDGEINVNNLFEDRVPHMPGIVSATCGNELLQKVSGAES